VYKRLTDGAHAHEIAEEAKLAASARSRNVVEIYDVIADENSLPVGVVMEYLDGADVSTFDLSNQQDLSSYLLVLYQAASALRDLHSIGITHRDLKPENLRRNSSAILKVIDFGIAVQGEGYKTIKNRGTRLFAAPELYEPNIEISTTMDVYAFGVVAWVLSGEELPTELSTVPPMTAQVAGDLSGLVPDLGVEVGQIIRRCLAREPNMRPSAGELVRVLERRLVRGQHVGVFSYHRTRELKRIDSVDSVAEIVVGSVGKFRLKYDGYDFRVAAVEGQVWINNNRAVVGAIVPLSCVFSFGHPNEGAQRQHVSFSASRPGVVL
jgi:serine/threonine-protein kinase